MNKILSLSFAAIILFSIQPIQAVPNPIPSRNNDTLVILQGGIGGGFSTNWTILGNAGTAANVKGSSTPGINFLGTTDLENLEIRTNSSSTIFTRFCLTGQIEPVIGSSMNTFFGLGAGFSYNASAADSGSTENTFIGFNAGNANIGGMLNTGIGSQSLQSNTTGSKNTAIGEATLKANTSGGTNTAIGQSALSSNITGSSNVAIGQASLSNNTSGGFSVAVGEVALLNNTTGSNNVAVGQAALVNNDVGSENTAVGQAALVNNTSGNQNTAMGQAAMVNNTTGASNVGVGQAALVSNTTGSDNTGIGQASLVSNSTGSANTAVGQNSLLNNTTSSNHAALGQNALLANTTGADNTAIGQGALSNNTTGSSNVAVGQGSLPTNITGSTITVLGAGADVGADGLTNATALGAGAVVNTNNTVQIGNTSVTVIEGQVAYTFPSDGRFKTDVQENVPGLAFITKLRPVTYHLDMDLMAKIMHTSDSARSVDGEKLQSQIVKTGFIAQEVEQAANEVGYDFDGVNKPQDDQGHYSLAYAEFVVPLVKGMQEQQILIEHLIKENAQFKKDIEEMKALIKQ